MIKTALRILTACTLAAALAACGNPKEASKSNFGKAIQAKLDTEPGLCVGLNDTVGKDITLSKQEESQGTQVARRLNALEKAGLLTKKEGMIQSSNGEAEPGYTFEVSDKGKKYLKSNSFFGDALCSGKFKVSRIDNFSEPSEHMGFKNSQVQYHYKLAETDSWIKDKALRDAYSDESDFSKIINGKEVPSVANLILTNEGWMEISMFEHPKEKK